MELDNESAKRAGPVQEFVDRLAGRLSSDYGPGVHFITIGLTCIRSRPGYEDWYKPRPPRFRKMERIKMLDGTIKEFRNTFTYDVKLSDDEHHQFASGDLEGAIEMVAEKLVESLSSLDSLPPSVRSHFKVEQFRSDFRRHVSELIEGSDA